MSGPRVGLIGARRKRQGLGPFVARDLRAAGVEVACLLGTSPETAAAASRQLLDRHGIETQGYVDLEQMLGDQQLDALAILSPAETHETYLERALSADLHVLCEKPLLWGAPQLAKRSESLVRRYAERGLLLRENCQWPYTLPAFRELHPDSTGTPTHFAMQLSPISSGTGMLGDAMPHVLSMLQALCPGTGRIASPSFETVGEGLRLAFAYLAGDARVSVEVELVRSDQTPRPAAYAIDGRWAHRYVRLPEYALRFGVDQKSVAARDPLGGLIYSFVSELGAVIRGRTAAPNLAVAERMRMLEDLVLAFERATPESAGSARNAW